jgi:hypothetical protein
LCIKFNSSLIEEGEKEVSYMSKISNRIKKNDFIIWRYEDGPIKVEESNTFLKTYTHSCEHPVREARNLFRLLPIACNDKMVMSFCSLLQQMRR